MNKKPPKDSPANELPAEKNIPDHIGGELRSILERVMETAGDTVQEEAAEQAAEVREMVAPGGKLPPIQESLFKWAGFPTDMTRVSPFFPLNVKDLKDRPFLKGLIITAAQWGEITYTGPKLSTYEEDSLLVLLACLEVVSKHRSETTDKEGRKTYTYRGPALPLLRALGYKQPGAKDYKRLIESLRLLTVAGVDLRVSARSKNGGAKEPRFTSMSAMLANVSWDNKDKILSATINPFFYEAYLAGTVTLMNVAKRMSLSGTIARSLYRFVQSHRDNPVFSGHFLTLAQVLNMDTEQPGRKLRELLKKAISELIKNGILTKKSRFISQDIVQLYRSDEALPGKPPAKALK
ncbi:MAG TPA: hypothetical protein VKF36_03645 [Syntrophorhabdales bacterium]|nr:hypothetical protein [Syntrophorhabdales bacterium]